jgi:hypothetical protein
MTNSTAWYFLATTVTMSFRNFSDETSQDLRLLHDKLDRTRAVDQTNKEVKGEFIGE